MTARKQKKRSDSPNSSHSGFAASDSTNLSTTPPTHASNTTTTSDLSSADGVLKEDASSGVIESPKLPLVYGKSVAGLQGSEKAKALPHIVVCVPNHKDRITVTLGEQDTLQDVRQILVDIPKTCHLTQYDLFVDGVQLPEIIELASLPQIAAGTEIKMVPTKYDQRSVRAHVKRLQAIFQRPMSQSSPKEQRDKSSQSEHANANSRVSLVSKSAVTLGDFHRVLQSYDPVPNNLPLPQLSISGWGPVSRARVLAGDLLYLEVAFSQEKILFVTGWTQGFFLNSSTKTQFDPSPSPTPYHSHNLVDLLSQAHPNFRSTYHKLASFYPNSDSHEVLNGFFVPFPPHKWIEPETLGKQNHNNVEKAVSAMDALYVGDMTGVQREWNEELQALRGLPHDTPEQRILRDRALFRFHCDFVETARIGAEAIIENIIPPINPMDPLHQQVFLFHNIFFSRSKNWLENARDKQNAPATSSQDGGKWGQCAPELAIPETPYTRANNELKGAMGYNEANVAGLHTVATAVVDYRGHRLLAQGIIPGIMQGEKGSTPLMGALTPNKPLVCEPEFHKKMQEAGKALHIASRPVIDPFVPLADQDGHQGQEVVEVVLCGAADCKGLMGCDGRAYVLDVGRVTPRDLNFGNLEHDEKFSTHLFRPTLVQSFVLHRLQQEVAAKFGSYLDHIPTQQPPSQPTQTPNGNNNVTPSTSDNNNNNNNNIITNPNNTPTTLEQERDQFVKWKLPQLAFNVNVGTTYRLGGTPEQQAADVELIRDLARFAKETVAVQMVEEFHMPERAPVDGDMLREAMHGRGLNMRYLDTVHGLCKGLPHVQDLCKTEVVVRTAKHILRAWMRASPVCYLGEAVAQFLNALVAVRVTSPSSRTGSKRHKHHDNNNNNNGTPNTLNLTRPRITPAELWSQITTDARERFNLEVSRSSLQGLGLLAVVRSLCMKAGVCLVNRNFDFSSAAPFDTHDITSLSSLVKHMVSMSFDAVSLMNEGKRQALSGQPQLALDVLSEALALMYQCCPMQPEVGECHNAIANVNFSLGEFGRALFHQERALNIVCRCRGPDHYETMRVHANLALFAKYCGQHDEALKHSAQALYCARLLYHSNHPENITPLLHFGSLLCDVGPEKRGDAVWLMHEALRIGEQGGAMRHVHVPTCLHALALAEFKCGNSRKALEHEKVSLEILKQTTTPDDPRIQEARDHIQLFISTAVEQAKGEQTLIQHQALASGTQGIQKTTHKCTADDQPPPHHHQQQPDQNNKHNNTGKHSKVQAKKAGKKVVL